MELLSMIGPIQMTILIFAGFLALLFPLLALISILKNEFPGSNKLIWVLVVIFLPYLGAILYFLIGRPQRIGK